MTNRAEFMETLHEVSEIIRTSPEPLTREEILGYFKDMELSEEQSNMVFEYLLTPHEDEAEQTQEEPEESATESNEAVPESKMLQMYREEVASLAQNSPEELREMYAGLLGGDSSDIKTIANNWLPKVIDLASKRKLLKANIEDVIQEGNIAMFTKLNELCGINEKTDIVAELLNAITDGMDTYISQMAGEDDSEHAVLAKVNLVNEARKYLREHNGTEPDKDQIAGYTNLPEDELTDILEIIRTSEQKKGK